MKIIRYSDSSGTIRYAAETAPGRHQVLKGDPYGAREVTSEVATIGQLLAPIVPTQILGIGLNYRHHAAESGMKAPTYPVLFFKGVNTLQHPNAPIVLPRKMASHEVDYECELAVVIGRTCKNVSRQNALDYVLGYTCANDVSARDWQLKFGGGQWCRGKTFDTFSPLGPCLVTTDEIPDPSRLKIRTILNGRTVQDWNTGDMIFDIPTIIEFLSGSTTLVPGTVILTGTPHGVGMAAKPNPLWLKAGDSVTIEVDAIGALTNPVVEESV
ncbi:MAG: fumarylacetoacetate hydrolase family protein [Opitutaceae bacterium]|nr:fumarylacetoacetate hydrolase family protein [Opitutaceae bacterium]